MEHIEFEIRLWPFARKIIHLEIECDELLHTHIDRHFLRIVAETVVADGEIPHFVKMGPLERKEAGEVVIIDFQILYVLPLLPFRYIRYLSLQLVECQIQCSEIFPALYQIFRYRAPHVKIHKVDILQLREFGHHISIKNPDRIYMIELHIFIYSAIIENMQVLQMLQIRERWRENAI